MTDLLLAHGWFLHDDPAEQRAMRPYPPLGLLYVAAHLRDVGVDVAVWDGTFRYRGEFVSALLERRPPVVGFYANMVTRKNILRMAAVARRLGARTVVGGPDPANYVEHYLDADIDAVVLGEGELTMAEALPRLLAAGPPGPAPDLHGVAGIAFRDDEGVTIRTTPRAQIKDLDDMPGPARDLIDLDAYLACWKRHHGVSSVNLITARGCPFHCNWCSHAVYGHSHRRRTPAHVADEVEELLQRYRPDQLWFADDVFTIHKKWLQKFAGELERRGVRVPFETITREDRLDDETIDLLAKMGARKIWVGAESGSQRILDAMQRSTDASRVVDVVRKLRAAGIETGMFLMLGYEGEDLADLEASIDMVARAAPDVFLTTVSYPIAGTPYAAQVADRTFATRAWRDGSDRDLTIAGRHSPRWFDAANRWLVHEVAARRARQAGVRSVRDAARLGWSTSQAALGRAAMRWFEAERVAAPSGSSAPA